MVIRNYNSNGQDARHDLARDNRMLPETELDKNAWTSGLHNVIEHYAAEIDAGRATTEDFRIHVRAGIGIENKEQI